MTPPPDLAQQAAAKVFECLFGPHAPLSPEAHRQLDEVASIIREIYAPYFESASARELAERAVEAAFDSSHLSLDQLDNKSLADIIESIIAPRMKAAEDGMEVLADIAKFFDAWCPTECTCAAKALPLHEAAIAALASWQGEKGR